MPEMQLNYELAELARNQNDRRAKVIAEILGRVERQKADPRQWRDIAISAIALSAVITSIQWLDGGEGAYSFAMWIAGISVAICFVTAGRISLLSQVEKMVVDEGRKGGFEIAKRHDRNGLSNSYSVSLPLPVQQYVEDHDAPAAQPPMAGTNPELPDFMDAMTAAAMMANNDQLRREFAENYREDMVGLFSKLTRLQVLGGPCDLHSDRPAQCTICNGEIASSSFFVAQPNLEGNDDHICGRCFLHHGDGIGNGIGELYWAVGNDKWRAVAGTRPAA